MNLAERLHEAAGRDRRVRVLARKLAPLFPEGAVVLDVGSGDGRLAAALGVLRPDLRWRGVDVLVRPDAAIPVERFDGIRLPVVDGAVDVVLLVDVLHHCVDPGALLAEAARVARVLVIKDHLADAPMARHRLRFMDHVGNARFGVPLPHQYWKRAEWEKAFRSLGLAAEVFIERLGLYPPPLSWLFEGSLHFAARLRR